MQGYVKRISGNNEYGNLRIYFNDDIPPRFYFLDEKYYYPDLREEDCVAATGVISINEDGVLFMRVNGELKGC